MPTKEKEIFDAVKRAKSFNHASRGIGLFIKTTPNAWIQLFMGALAFFLGFFLNISETEWLFIILSTGFTLVAEAFNTAIEIDMDLTSPEYHPYARDTKDVAAGAVLIAASTSLLIGLIIFLPKIYYFLK